MNIQNQFWNFLVQLKAWIFYLDEYADISYKWERRINIITAVASSSSIAAWVIWDKLEFIWGFIIAVSQVISAINKYFPFKKRIEISGTFIHDLEALFFETEYIWFKVASGQLTEDEINDELFKLKNKYNKLSKENLKQTGLLENKRIKKHSDIKTEQYFNKNYASNRE